MTNVFAILVAGVRAKVALIMRRNGKAIVDVEFEFEDDICNSEPTDIVPVEGAAFVEVSDINELGEVAGTSHSNSSENTTEIFGGPTFTAVSGINNSGEIAGYYIPSGSSSYRAFVWRSESGLSELPTLGNGSVARAINDSGVVVGEIENTLQGGRHAALWGDDVTRDLGTLGGSYSTANDINEAGTVVGEAALSDFGFEIHAFIWSDGTTMRDLGTLGGSHSNALFINERGQVVGLSETAEGDWHGFIWEDGTMRDLGAFGSDEAAVAGINDVGQVVGSSQHRAFTWEGGAMREAGIALSRMRGINNRGDAIAESCPPGATINDLCSRAVLVCANRAP